MRFFPIRVLAHSGSYVGKSKKGKIIPVWYNAIEDAFYTFLPENHIVTENTKGVKPIKIRGIVEVAHWEEN